MNFLEKDAHRTMHFKTTGKVVYDPVRAVKNDVSRILIEVDDADLLSYYRFQFWKKFGIVLEKPNWSAHLTVLATDDKNNEPWHYLDGKIVEVSYSHYMFWNESMVWVAAEAKEMSEIREHYGIIAMDRGHLTVGKFKTKNIIPTFKNFTDEDHNWSRFPNNPWY